MKKRPLIFIDPHPRTEEMVYLPETQIALERMGRVVAHFGSRAPEDLVEQVLPEVEILIGQTAMPSERLERAPKLKAILNVKANWEPTLDYAEAQARGIYVLSAAPAMAPAVAEFCLAQALVLARGLQQADGLFRSGQEAYGINGNRQAYSLYGAEIGLLGFGNLGQALLPLLQPFGGRIRVHDPWLPDGFLRRMGMEPVSLKELLSNSQFLFLLAGVTSENQGFLGPQELGWIPQGATVVLASRAEIVDFDTFLALAADGVFRAAVDVFPEEPVPLRHPWRQTPNVLFSSHLAGGLHSSYARIREMMLEDVQQILSGLPPVRMQRAEPRLAARMRSR